MADPRVCDPADDIKTLARMAVDYARSAGLTDDSDLLKLLAVAYRLGQESLSRKKKEWVS